MGSFFFCLRITIIILLQPSECPARAHNTTIITEIRITCSQQLDFEYNLSH